MTERTTKKSPVTRLTMKKTVTMGRTMRNSSTTNTLTSLTDDELIRSLRDSVIPSCEKCGAWCCRNGKLPLPDDASLNAVVGKELKKYEKEKRLERTPDGTILLTLAGGCPNITNEQTCKNYAKRPLACRNYPFFLFGKTVVVAQCPGVGAGFANEHLEELKKRGFVII